MKKAGFFCLFFIYVFMGMIDGAMGSESAMKFEGVNPQSNNSRGRFQLFNAVYHSALIQKNQITKFLDQKLFRVDTRTGKTWMLIDVMKGGNDIKYWEKITTDYPVFPNDMK